VCSSDLAGPDGAPPAGVVGVAPDDGEFAVAAATGSGGRHPVTLLAGPGREMDLQVRVAAPDAQPGAGGEVAEGPIDQDVGAAVEAEVLKVDSRVQR